MPVQYMARENDLRTWTFNKKVANPILSHWLPFHTNWIDQQCMAIVGSPYRLTIEYTDADDQNRTMAPSTRFCRASATLKPGYWQVTNGTRRQRPYQAIGAYKRLWEQPQSPQFRYVTPGCDWELPNLTRIATCLAPYHSRFYMVGDSLIRQLGDGLKSYFRHIGLTNVTFGGGAKTNFSKPNCCNGDMTWHPFDQQSGIFIDDFNIAHHVGWGILGDLDHRESSPGRLAYELQRHRAFLKAQPTPGNDSRFFYYATNYINDWRAPQTCEPLVSYYSAIAAEFLTKESVFELFSPHRVLQPIPEGTGDGIHYHNDIVSMLVIMLLNSICDEDGTL